VFTIDDVHPGTSSDAYEAGGDLGSGALRHVEWLLQRHPELHVTLFVTADWRQILAFPTRTLLARIPWLSDRWYLTPVLQTGAMRLDRHPEFVRYLASLPRTDIALHGLHHIHTGPRIGMEFQRQSRIECARVLLTAKDIFTRAGLRLSPGLQPPVWNLTPNLAAACVDAGLLYVAAARDLTTTPADGALTHFSGPCGLSLMHPTILAGGRLVHLATNFQATCDVDRAFAVLDCGGVLAIKAHIIKRAGNHVSLDGLDEVYRSYLDALLRLIGERYGNGVWLTTMEEVARRVLGEHHAHH
jgi:hypothetical protein